MKRTLKGETFWHDDIGEQIESAKSAAVFVGKWLNEYRWLPQRMKLNGAIWIEPLSSEKVAITWNQFRKSAINGSIVGLILGSIGGLAGGLIGVTGLMNGWLRPVD
jgi:hypothetical protein